MTTNIKVAGTTFHPLPKNKAISILKKFEMDGIPCATARAILQPEPMNQYDPEAVMVLVRLNDGSAFHLGYLPKTEPMKTKVKKPLIAFILIKDYGQMGNYNASFIITEIWEDCKCH